MNRRSIPVALAGAMLLAAAPAWAQTLGQGQSTDVPWWRVAAALLLCLGLAIGAALVLKKRLGGASPVLFGKGPRRVQLVDSVRLNHQVDLCVVHYDGKELLVAAGPNGASVLAQGEAPQGPQP